MDDKTVKHVENLYRSAKNMPLLTVLAVFVPIVMLFVAPLGVVYAVQRSLLLRRIGTEDADPRVAEQVRCLRKWSIRLLVPMIICVGFVLLFAVLLMMHEPSPRP